MEMIGPIQGSDELLKRVQPFKEFNYKPYWVLKMVAALKSYNTPFEMSSEWLGTLPGSSDADSRSCAPLPAVPRMDATFQVNSLLL